MHNFPGFADHIYALLFGLIIPFVSGYRSAAAFQDIAFDSSTKKRLYRANSLSIGFSAMLIVGIWLIYQRPLSALGFNLPRSVSNWALALTGLFLVLYIADIISSLYPSSSRTETIEHWENNTPFLPTKPGELPMYFVMCVSAGLFEEIIYRGFFITYAEKLFASYNYPGMWAVTLPAMVFSIAHIYQGHKAVFKILLLSFLFGLIYYLTRSLLIVVILHFLVDWVGGLLNYYFMRKQMEKELPAEEDKS
jgi:uncharacterized protein